MRVCISSARMRAREVRMQAFNAVLKQCWNSMRPTSSGRWRPVGRCRVEKLRIDERLRYNCLRVWQRVVGLRNLLMRRTRYAQLHNVSCLNNSLRCSETFQKTSKYQSFYMTLLDFFLWSNICVSPVYFGLLIAIAVANIKQA